MNGSYCWRFQIKYLIFTFFVNQLHCTRSWELNLFIHTEVEFLKPEVTLLPVAATFLGMILLLLSLISLLDSLINFTSRKHFGRFHHNPGCSILMYFFKVLLWNSCPCVSIKSFIDLISFMQLICEASSRYYCISKISVTRGVPVQVKWLIGRKW